MKLFVYLFSFFFSVCAFALLEDSHLESVDRFALQAFGRGEHFFTETVSIHHGPHFLFANPNLLYFAGLSLDLHNENWEVSTRYTYSTRENHHYIRPYQFAFKIPRIDGQWVLGRYLLDWDWADHFWNRGLWQAFYREDALRAKQAGLVGVFREFSYDHLHLTLFGSPVFIPESGPYFTEENGSLVSNNPWFLPPSNKKIGFTNIIPSYRIAPSTWKDALKLSLAGQVSYKQLYMGYAYKPINKVQVKSAINLDLNSLEGSHEEGYSTDILLEPVLLKHHLMVFGWNWEEPYDSATGLQNIYRLKTSVTYHHPEILTLKKSDVIFFQPKKEWHFSIKGELEVQDTMEKTVLYIAYTHRFYGKDSQQNTLLEEVFPIPEEQQFFRNDLFQFTQAASVGLSHSLKWTEKQSTKIKTRLIYHFVKKYFLLSAEGSLALNPYASIFIGGDIIFLGFPFNIEQTTTDIGIYKNKTRIFGGLSYVF